MKQRLEMKFESQAQSSQPKVHLNDPGLVSWPLCALVSSNARQTNNVYVLPLSGQ